MALSPESIRQYRRTARNFLSYLGADHPKVQRLDQLHREPHILGWMSRLRSQVPPLATASYLIRLICLRGICNELAWTEQLPELAHLIRREDIPRLPHRLPRPLTADLRLERPNPCSAALFVSLKGRARGTRITAAGLRSLFRYHRQATGIQLANPHRFRHYSEFRTITK